MESPFPLLAVIPKLIIVWKVPNQGINARNSNTIALFHTHTQYNQYLRSQKIKLLAIVL